MAGLHTFLRYAERAERHRNSGGKYGTLRREIEQKLAFPPKDSDELRNYTDSLRERWDKLSEDCPTAPNSIWRSAGVEVKAIMDGKSARIEAGQTLPHKS
jgi:phytoene dehydrogenase-like protein